MTQNASGISKISPAPHLADRLSTGKIMWITLTSLLAPALAGIIHYGWKAVGVILVAVASAAVTDLGCRKLRGQKLSLGPSSLITGLLLALILPPGLPLWITALGAIFAVGIVKEAFGGLGQNIFNPALGARVFLLASFSLPMSQYLSPGGFGADAVTSATPLSPGFTAAPSPELYWNMLTGNVPGVVGFGGLFILLGALLLLAAGIIDWRAPLAYLATVALTSLAFGLDPVFHMLAGGCLFTAFYFVTDPVSTPLYRPGRIIFAVGAGLLTMLIRHLGNAPDGIAYAVLIMNAFTPLIDRYVKPRPFGTRRAERNAA